MSSVFVPPPSPERALTPAQRQALLAIRAAAEVEAAVVADATGMKPNSAGLALRGLQRRGLVARQDDDPPTWTATFAGRALAERLGDGDGDGDGDGGDGDGRDAGGGDS